MSIINRIMLGTANFAKEYRGHKVKKVDEILEYARKSGIIWLDTATAYDTHRLEWNGMKQVKFQKGQMILDDNVCAMAHGVEHLPSEGWPGWGLSCYPEDLAKKYYTMAVQVPYSILDRRIDKYTLPYMQVQARSVFCGGEVLREYSPFEALSFVLMDKRFSLVVLGTDSLQMLQDTLEPFLEMERAGVNTDVIELRDEKQGNVSC